MALPNARNQYLKTQIETASKEQLVVMLFDGIIRFTEQARKAIVENHIEDSHHSLMRAQAIIMELICTVDKDKGGEIASNLMSLHAYAFNCLIKCNLQKELSYIDEVQKIYRELRTAWATAMETAGISATKAPTGPHAPQPTPPRSGPGVTPPVAPAPAPADIPAASNQGLMASAAPASASIASQPAAPLTNAYGMGRTASLMAGMGKPVPAAGDAPAGQGQVNVNSMLSAYNSNTRITA